MHSGNPRHAEIDEKSVAASASLIGRRSPPMPGVDGKSLAIQVSSAGLAGAGHEMFARRKSVTVRRSE